MEWSKLLSAERPDGSEKDKGSLRSPFEQDYHKIIGSAAFRRLQDKTQVFPLDKSDFIRTRLTHSLEVSACGRAIGEIIGEELCSGGQDPKFTETMKEDLCEILQCAGLIHDIGNPPFGHFGEETIRDWFIRNLDSLKIGETSVSSCLNEQERADLLHFEGNAQGLRLVSSLHFPDRGWGMNLTCGLLSAIIKYPVSALEMDPLSENIAARKNGYFESESDLFHLIGEKTGTYGKRNPMAFMLEAADDIAYGTADIEDAFKKGYLSLRVLTGELNSRGTEPEIGCLIRDHYEQGIAGKVHDAEEYAVMNGLADIRNILIRDAAHAFLEHYREIMTGDYRCDLFSGSRSEALIKALKTIAYDYAFTTQDIFRTEIAANTILNYLLDHLVPAALAYDTGKYPGLMEEKFLSLISENYKAVYRRQSFGRSENEKVYLKLRLAADALSGMTDSHARDLYRELNGGI